MSVIEVSDPDFETQVLRSELPVLIDLYAEWCQPCRQLSPIVEEVARELSGKIRAVKIDIDRSPMIAQAFRVQSVPMLIVMHQGQLVGHQMGLVDKAAILKMLEPVLPASAQELQPKDLHQLLQQGKALAVDLRDKGSFARSHIPGAIHVPAEALLERSSELQPSDGRLRVLYGRTGDQGRELAEKLQEEGLQVGFLSGGLLFWESEDLEVERSA